MANGTLTPTPPHDPVVDQFQMLLRGMIYSLGGGLVSSGMIDAASWNGIATLLAGVIVIALNVVWQRYVNRLSNVISRVAEEPQVAQIVTTAAIAQADPSEKVVSVGSAGVK